MMAMYHPAKAVVMMRATPTTSVTRPQVLFFFMRTTVAGSVPPRTGGSVACLCRERRAGAGCVRITTRPEQTCLRDSRPCWSGPEDENAVWIQVAETAG